MDNWQKQVYDTCATLVNSAFECIENESKISLGQREAYVVMKALEDQQRYLHPMLQTKVKDN